MPSIFHTAYTLEASDVTARLASRPELLRAVFPLTHNLRALEIVPVGLRMRQTGHWRLDSDKPQHGIRGALGSTSPADGSSHSTTFRDLNGSRYDENSTFLPPQDLHRTVSAVSLCGFIGSSSIVRLPVVESPSPYGCCPGPRDNPTDPTASNPRESNSAESSSSTPGRLSMELSLNVPTKYADGRYHSEPNALRDDHNWENNGVAYGREPQQRSATAPKFQILRRSGSVPETLLTPDPRNRRHHSSSKLKSPVTTRVVPEDAETPRAPDPQKLDHLLSLAGASTDSSGSELRIAVCFLGQSKLSIFQYLTCPNILCVPKLAYIDVSKFWD